eukprot:TRINITY_DN3574_c0_g6_i1.p1 TRINITY_DN3574_c0_g6~~TRINITY_DN3574_c0_g6_i1.p1  ORF type:complete len:834 (+),score=381.92 TRINITY_DN3574_c0_g6_i1:86-2587(+)
MAFGSEGFFVSVLISSIVCLVLLVIAKNVHHSDKLFGKVAVWRAVRSQWPGELPTAFNFGGFGAIKSSFGEAFIGGQDPWMEAVQGAEARLYLTFLRLSGIVFMFIGLVSPMVLIPTFVTDNYVDVYYWREVYPEECCDDNGVLKKDVEHNFGLAHWTLRNVSPGSFRMWAVVIVGAVLVYEICALMSKMVVALRKAKAKSVFYTAVVKGCGKTREEIRENAVAKVPEGLRAAVTEVAVPLVPVKGLMDAMDDLKEAKTQLEGMYAIIEKEKISADEMFTHEELEVKDKKCCGSKVNGVQHWRQQHDELTEKVQELKKQMEDEGEVAGVAYITFATPAQCAEFVAGECSKKGGALEKAMRLMGEKPVWFAPMSPAIILYDNLGTPAWRQTIGKVVSIGILWWMAIFWGAIIGFAGNLENFGLDTDSWDPQTKGLLDSYLPVIVAAVLTALVPMIIRNLVEHLGKSEDKMDRETLTCRYFSYYQIATLLVMQAILQGGGDAFDHLTDFDSVLVLFTDILAPSNGYFVVLVMSSALVGCPARLGLFGAWIGGAIKSKLAKTKTQADEAWHRTPFVFSEEYARAVLIYSFVALLSVSVPYMGIFGAIYFYLKYLTDRAILSDHVPRCRNSRLQIVPEVVHIVMGLSVVFALFGLALFSAIKERWGACGFGVAVLVLVLVFNYKMKMALEHMFSEEFLTGVSHPVPVLPNILGLITGYDTFHYDDTVVESVVDTPMPAVEAAAEPQVAADVVSAYENPCTRLVGPEKLDHEAMRDEKWYFEESDAIVAKVEMVAPDVFFENRTIDDLEALLASLKKVEHVTEPFAEQGKADVTKMTA